MRGQLLDRDAAITQDALVTVDVGDCGRAGTGIAVAIIKGDVACAVAQHADVDRQFILDSLDDREIMGLSIQFDATCMAHGLGSMDCRGGVEYGNIGYRGRLRDHRHRVAARSTQYTAMGALANLDHGALGARRCRQYSTTPGMMDRMMIIRITRVKLFLTNGRLPKK